MGLNNINFEEELIFKAVRSSGAGGQNVNKLATKVQLQFDVINSRLLNEMQKKVIMQKLAKRITADGLLYLAAQSERTQIGNKERVKKIFYKLITDCFKPVKKRVATKPGKKFKENRLKAKKRRSETKKLRSRAIE